MDGFDDVQRIIGKRREGGRGGGSLDVSCLSCLSASRTRIPTYLHASSHWVLILPASLFPSLYSLDWMSLSNGECMWIDACEVRGRGGYELPSQVVAAAVAWKCPSECLACITASARVCMLPTED